MSISFSGLASGLDTSSWVESLVALKKAKVTSLEEEKKEVQSLQETLSKIKTFFSSFRSMLEKVTDAKFGVASMDLFAQNLATSSNLEALTASATTEAEEATYNVFVDKLASETKANSNYSYMTTIIQTTTATNDSKLINLGVKAGNIGVTVKGVEHGIDITENDTISSFIEKLNKIGVKASYNENSGVFSIDISSGDIKDIGSTGIVDKLHLKGVNEGYTSDNLKTSTTDTIFSAATESTKLSELGVKAGTITVNSNDKDYSITIKDTTTIGDLINELKKNNIDANINSEGIFTITDATIKNEGTTKILDALGLTNTVYEKSQITGNLKHSSLVVTTTTATNATLLKDLGTGTAISDKQTVIVKNSNNESKTITVGTTTTLGKLLEEFSNAGLYAALKSDGTVEIAGGTITGGTFDAVKALGLEKEPYSAIVTGKSLTETIEVHKIVTLQTKLVDELKVSEGYLEVTDANNAKHYEKIYSGQTIADFMADMGNLGINTSLDEDTGVLTITGGSFKTLSDADVLALIANGTIRETDARYKKGTNLLKCLYGADAISANQTSVASSSAKSRALRHTVTNTIDATKSTTLGNLGLTGTGTAIFDIRGEKRTINVDKTMTIEGLMKALKDVGIASSWSEEHSKILIENVTLTGGTSNLKDVLNLSTEISGKYITSNELYSTDTITIDATRDTVLKDYGILNSMSQADRTVTIFNSNGTVAGSTVVSENTTIGNLIDFINTKSGIKASIVDGYLKVNNGYIGNKTLERTMGLVTSNKSSYVLGSVMTVTTTDAVAGDTTLENIFKTIGSADKVKDGYTLFFNSKSINVSATTTLDELIMKIYNAGGTASMDATGRLAIDGGTLTGTVARALGVTSVTNTASVAATGKTLLVKQTIYANRDTKFSDLGIAGNTSYIVHNSLGQATTTVTLANTTSLGAFLDGLKAYQIDGVIADGVIKLDSASGQYITGALTTSLGIGTQTVSDIVNTTVYSTSAVQYTASGKADISTRLGAILTVNNSNNKMIVYNSLNSAKTTITVDATTTVDQWFAMLAKQGIQAEVNQGVFTFISKEGNYVSGSIIDSFGMTPTTVTVTKTTGTTATSSRFTHTVNENAKITDKLSSFVTVNGNQIITVKNSETGATRGTATITSNTTFEQMFKALDDLGIQGTMEDGIITLTSNNGAWATGGILTTLGISTVTQTSTTSKTVGTSVSSGRLYYTQSITATTDTTLSSLGYNSNYSISVMKPNGGTIIEQATITLNSSTTIDQLFDKLDDYGVQGIIADGIITFTSATGAYVQDKSGGLLSGMGISAMTYVQTIFVTSTIKQTITTSFKTTNTQPVQYTTTSWQTTVTIPADTVTVTVNTSGTVPGREVVVTITQEATSPTIVTYISQTTTSNPVTVNFSTTIPSQTVTHSYSTVVTQNFTVTQTVATSQTIVGQTTSVSTTTTTKTGTLLTNLTGVDISVGNVMTIQKKIEDLNYSYTFTVKATSTLNDLMNFFMFSGVIASLIDVSNDHQSIKVSFPEGSTIAGSKLSIGGSLAEKLSLGCILYEGDEKKSNSFIPNESTVTTTTKTTTTINTTQTITTTKTTTVTETKSTTITDSFTTVIGARTVTYSTTVPGQTLTTGGWYTFYPKKTSVTGVFTISTSSVTVDSSGTAVVKTPAHTVTIKGTSTITIPSTTTSVAGTVTVTVNTTTTATVTQTYGLNSNSNRQRYSVTLNADDTTTLTTGSGTGTISGVYQGRSFTVTAGAGKSIGEVLTELAGYGISGSISSGTVTLKGTGDGYITSISGAFGINGSNYYTSTTTTITTGSNTLSNRQNHNVTYSAEATTKISQTSAGKGTITVNYQGNTYYVTVSDSKTIGDIMNELAGYGVSGSLNGGVLKFQGTGDGYVTNWGGAFGLTGASYSTVTTTIKTNKTSNEKTYTSNNVTLTTATKISSINGYSGGNGSLIIHKTDGTYATISVDASKTLGELFTQLANYGLVGRVDDTGKVSIEGIGNVYLQAATGGSNILTALKLSNVVSNVKTVTVNRTSATLHHTVTVAAKGTTTLGNLQASDNSTISFSGNNATLIISAYSDAGNKFATLTFTKTQSIYDVIASLANYGIDARIDSNGRFSVSSSTLNDFSISGTLGTFLMGSYTKKYGTDTTYNISTNLRETTTVFMKDSDALSKFGITGGNIIVNQEGVHYTVNIDTTKVKTIGDFRNLLSKYGFNSYIDDHGRLNIEGIGNSTLIKVNGGSNILDKLGLTNWTLGEITQDSDHLTDTEIITRKISMSDKLKELTNSAGVNLGITAGQIYVYQDGTRSTININTNDTLETLAAKLSQYGISIGISQNGQLYFDGNNDSYLTTNGIAGANASNILQKFGISGTWSTRYDSTSEKLDYTTTSNNVVSGSTKLKNLNGTDGKNLGITTGSFYVYNSGVRTTETITADMTVNDLKALLAKYGLITDIDENGSISIGAYDNTYLATSALASANSNIVSTLFAKWDFVNIYKSNHLDIPTDEIRAITRDTKLSDINEGTYKAGIITVVKDGVQTNITLTSDDTVGTLMDELALYGFESVINDKGQLMIKNTGDSLLQNYSDASKASNALTLLGIDLNSWITTNSYQGGPLEVTKTTTINAVAGRETLLSNLGVTTGEYYVFNNGVKYTAMISSDETIGSFMDTLKSFGIETSLVQGANGAVLSIVGKGDSYIKKSTSTTNSSNVVEQLFKTNKTAYEYKGLEQTSTLKTTFTAATEETLVSYFDKNASNKSEGDLTVIVNGQKNTLKITADETIGTLLQKFRDLGLEATVSNGQIMVQSGYDTMTISATGTTSKLLDNIKFEYKKDLGGYSASNNTVKSTTTSIEERTLSVASYADLNTKMGQLNISDGSLTVYRNGQKANIEVKANETFGNLRTRLSTAFSDLDLTFENGYLKIYSKNNDNVEIGSTTDTSNFGAITGIESNGSGIAKSSRELYCVNGDSVLTTSGIFRRGNVKAGTFTVGNAVFNITSTTTLSDIINQINASDAANASAFWDNVEGKLVIKSRSTGAALVNIEAGTSNFTDILGFTKSEWNTDGSIKTTKMDIDTQNIGDNAKIKINGTTYTSTSNTIGSDVTRIKGLTINLKGLTKDSEVTLKVERDKESLANAVSSVVDSYNELMKNVDDAIATDGDLKNESTLKLIRNQLRNLMTSSDMGTTVFRNLDSIGIGFNSASGNNISTANSAIVSLTFDKDKFFKAFDADQDAVKALIIGSANNKGVFTKVEDLVESTLKSVSGYFEATESSYSNKIRDLDKKITKANKEVDRYKARLEAKFQSMDMLIAQMQQQYSSFLRT